MTNNPKRIDVSCTKVQIACHLKRQCHAGGNVQFMLLHVSYTVLHNLYNPRCRGKDLECSAAGDHVAAVTGGIQACTEDGTVPKIIRQRKLSATAALTLQL